MTTRELLRTLGGECIEKVRADIALEKRIKNTSESYIDKPVEDWPELEFRWDFFVESQRFAFDGMSPNDAKALETETYDLICGFVSLEQFDRKLCARSSKSKQEFWSIGDKGKLAYLIVYLSEKRPVTPPYIVPLENGEILIEGGNHRYAVAKQWDLSQLPIYVSRKHKKAIEQLLDIEWTDG
ncbi:hypothetical protein UB34_13105 [Photobacterium leiognathi]|uniref:Transcriptional regulator n=2 Tax=Photobacterium leiognathi TaxID=553611 RepID=A0A2T3M7J1_PHOLE|nr:hypothetical protein UB34_13105 [Photobacterium leiognathi]PSV88254.1 transcriptional regulator [Photobacterium leiognathi]